MRSVEQITSTSEHCTDITIQEVDQEKHTRISAGIRKEKKKATCFLFSGMTENSLNW